MRNTLDIERHEPTFSDKDTIRKRLPKIGDKLKLIPTLKNKRDYTLPIPIEPQDCTVIYVNKEHLWYTVEFDIDGNKFRESYKLPEIVDEEDI